MDALVADANLRNAVAGIRGLGRAGVRAFAHAPARLGAGRGSRLAPGPQARGPADVAAPRRPRAALAAELPAGERVLAQERIAGRLLSLALVLDREGRVVGRFQEEVLRTWPRDAGSFAATVSTPVDGELEERAVGLLRGTGYWG